MELHFVILNEQKEYWTGSTWVLNFQSAQRYTFTELDTLEIDKEVHPDNFFNHMESDTGWSNEDGQMFARAIPLY